MPAEFDPPEGDTEGDAIDERPQRRREWSGPLRSIILPIAAVAAIVGVVWAFERGDDGAGVSGGGAIVARPASKMPAGLQVAPERGKVAPDFILSTVDGQSVRLSDFHGRPVFINFWATWCGPCRKEMPEIVAANERYAGRGLAVLAVNLQEDRDTAAGFVRQFGMTFPAPLDLRGEVGAAYRLTGLPTSFFIDRNGVIQDVAYGALSAEDMEKRIQKIL